MSLTLYVANKQAVTDTITEITLTSAGIDAGEAAGSTLPGYTAGSHIDINLGGETGIRSYSLIDWTAPPQAPTSYTIAVQLEPDGDGGSRQMHALSAGDTLAVSAPSNDFALTHSTGPALLVAGGIGITPLISMAASMHNDNKPFQLWYAGRSRSVMAYVDRLSEAFDNQVDIYADDENPLAFDNLLSSIDPATHLYICGPAGLIEATRAAAIKAGIAADQVHIELFATPDAKTTDAPFEVELAGSGEVHVVPPGKTIIEVLEAAGHDLMYDCQRGDCGICQTTVIEGTPDHRDVVLSDAERAAGNVIQVCVSRAHSKRLVLDL